MFGLFKQKLDGTQATKELAASVLAACDRTLEEWDAEFPGLASRFQGDAFKRELLAYALTQAGLPFSRGPLGLEKGGEFTSRIFMHAARVGFPTHDLDETDLAREAAAIGLGEVGELTFPPGDDPESQAEMARHQHASKLATKFLFSRFLQYQTNAGRTAEFDALVTSFGESFLAFTAIDDAAARASMAAKLRALAHEIGKTSAGVLKAALDARVVFGPS